MATKKTKLVSKTKFSFKNPALVIVVVLLVAVGVFFAFKTFASDGTISAAVLPGKDLYGCPLDYKKRPTVAYGSSGSCVKTVQNDLNSHFHNSGLVIDGQFGTKTKNTVILFQAQRGLTADGIVGPNTWHSLECATTYPPPGDCQG